MLCKINDFCFIKGYSRGAWGNYSIFGSNRIMDPQKRFASRKKLQNTRDSLIDFGMSDLLDKIPSNQRHLFNEFVKEKNKKNDTDIGKMDMEKFRISSLEDLQKQLKNAPSDFYRELPKEYKETVQSILKGDISEGIIKKFGSKVDELMKQSDVRNSEFSSKIFNEIELSKPLEDYSDPELVNLSDRVSRIIMGISKEDWRSLGIYDPPNFEKITIESLYALDKLFRNKGIDWETVRKLYDENTYLKNMSLKSNFEKSSGHDNNNISNEMKKDARLRRYRYAIPTDVSNTVEFTSESFHKQICELCAQRRIWEALSLIDVVEKSNDNGIHQIGANTYNLIIAALIPVDSEQAFLLYKKMIHKGFAPEIVVINGFLSINAENGSIDRVDHWFGVMRKEGLKADDVTYACLIRAYSKYGNLDKVLELLEEMKENGFVNPTALAYALELMIKVKAWKQGCVLIGEILLQKDKFVSNEFFSKMLELFKYAFKKDGKKSTKNLKKRQKEFENRISSDVGLLAYAIREKDNKKINSLWNKINTEKICDDISAYSELIRYHTREKRFEEGERVCVQLEQSGIEKNREICIIMSEFYRNMGAFEKSAHYLVIAEEGRKKEYAQRSK